MKLSERLLPYLRLVRAPAVFSALSDPLAGMLVARGRLHWPAALAMGTASGATYLGGMALNDYADREEDALERPHRPIPSGSIPPRRAAAVGAGLLGVGLGICATRGAVRSGTALAASVLAYDFLLKHTPAGPACMGACRALSLLSGAEAAGGGGQRALPAAALLGCYVAGLTILARGETGESGNRTALPGVVVAGSALAATAMRGGARAAPWVLATVALAGGAAAKAVREPSPGSTGSAVGAMIRAIPALDAAIAAPTAPRTAALVAAPLLVLARWGRRLIPIS